jgi:hypothetical protein
MKLPTRRYEPGEFLIKQGARATAGLCKLTSVGP